MSNVPPNNDHVVHHRDAAVLTITLNRPDRLNAVSEEMYRRLVDIVTHPEELDRVIVLEGEGRAFCVGADLKAHRTGRSAAEREAYVELAQAACTALQHSSLPVIAKVQGYALGAGAELALSCDLVVMADEAEIGFPELSLGTYVGGGLTYLLPALVGLARARELLFFGERITGRDAAGLGLIHRAVPESELDATVATIAGRLAELAPIPTRLLRRALRETAPVDRAEAMRREAEDLLTTMETEDWREGVRAFTEKRKPRFRGR
ncbi:MAG: enoyl-CoA hydratase/isomerase family protein [Acidimicrobiia bacterium]